MVLTRRGVHNSSRWSEVVVGCGCLFLGVLLSYNYFSVKTPGMKTIHSEKAWSLNVKLTFEEESDLNQILEEWTKVAKYCAEHEDFLLHYEVGLSDSNPLVVYILERYKTKDEYLSIHKKGSAFLNFRPKLAALQENGKVTIEGFSYDELGYGFTGKYIQN